MKGFKLLLVIMSAVMVTLGLSGISYAFHDGGAANCDGCHTMHNANGAGVSMSPKNGKAAFTGNGYLLQGSDQSSTCLNCHAAAEAIGTGYIIMSPDAGTTNLPTHFTPGGDFGWLLATPATPPTNYDKTRRGHNINAADFGLGVAPTLTAAPGGTYAQSNLHCSSCHDPHGTYRHTTGDPTAATDIASSVFSSGGASKPTSGSGSYGVKDTAGNAVGVYRLLAGQGYLPASAAKGGETAFKNDSPIAIAPSTYDVVATTFNVTGNTTTGSEVLVQYGQNMSEWCQNCHASTSGGMTSKLHPASSTSSDAKLSNQTVGSGSIAANYTSYIGSGNMPSGTNQYYSALVPVEVGQLTALTGPAPTNGTAPTVNGSKSNVMCLSCHRAHASAWQNMTRYDVNNQLMTVAGAYNTTSTGYSTTQYQNAMEGRPANLFASNQRILCNKCHAKD